MAHPPMADSREQFVYMLLPNAGGYQVMRAPLKQLLEISEAVSNVPAVLRVGPSLAAAPATVAPTLSLALAAFSTLAGNLTILASAANVIVVESARREGVEVRFLEHLAVGLPVTVGTLLLAWGWLLLF